MLGLGAGLNRSGFIKPFGGPSEIAGLQLWLDSTDTTTLNAKMAADFVAANSEYLSSASTDFDFGNTDFTISGWFKVDSIAAEQRLVAKWNAQTNNRSYLIYTNTSGQIVVIFSNDGTTTTTLTSTGTISASTWFSLSVVHDSINDLIKLSINGATFETAAHTTGLYSSSTEDFNLCYAINAAGTLLYGDVTTDGVNVYNKALTQTEVTNLYNSGNGVAYENLTTKSIPQLAADFVSTNSESLSSTSADFDKGNEDFSFGCWVNMDINTNGTEYILAGKWSITGNQRSYVLYKDSGTNTITFGLSNDGTTVTTVNSTQNFTVDTWYFAVCVYDSVNDLMKISINGANFVTASNTTGAYTSSTPDFTLGNSGYTANYLDGSIDGAFFYDKALSQTEVTNLYNSGNGTEYANLTTKAIPNLAAKFVTANSEYLNVANNTFIGGFKDFSVGCWVKVNSNGQTAGIMTNWNYTLSNRQYQIRLNSGNITLNWSPDGVNTGVLVNSTMTISDSWVFVVAVFDSTNGQFRLYKNVTEVISGSAFTSMRSGTNVLDIGSQNSYSSAASFLDGQIDNAFFYDKALTLAEVTALYNSGNGVNYSDLSASQLTDLVSWWSLDETSGNRADSHGTNTLTDNNTVGYDEGKVGTRNVDQNIDLVSWWELNETSGNRSDSHGANTLTDNNTVGYAEGKVGTRDVDQNTSLVSWWSLNEVSGNRADEVGGNTLTDNNTVGYALGKVQEPIEASEYVWRWVDKTVNATDFTQDTASAQPFYNGSGYGGNNLPYISTGTDRIVNTPYTSASTNHTVIAAVKSSASASQAIFDSQSGRLLPLVRYTTGKLAIFDGSYKSFNTTINYNTDYILAWRFDAANLVANGWVNGVKDATTLVYSPKSLGGDLSLLNFYNVTSGNTNAAEFCVFERALLDSEILKVMKWLNDKYAVY